ncbi:MAG: acyl-CoA dehydrogenase family protein [Actinomycetota bacterium]
MSNAILHAARDLGPAIAARSSEIESNGTLPLDVVDAIRPSQAFRLYVPTDLNGPAATAWEGLEVIEEYAYHDGSTGWCVAISATSSLMATYLQEPWATEIFADPGSITGGFAAPMGAATPVEGGLEVTGRWQWGSGTKHCTWVGGGCRVVGPDGKTAPRADGLAFPYAFFDLDDVEFLDTWDVAGLGGTGSVDYEVARAFVPEDRWVQIGFDPPQRENPFARFSFYGLLALGIAATAAGIGRRAVDELVLLAESKRPQGSSRPLRDRSTIQADVAMAEAKLRAAWGMVADTVGSAWETALTGDDLADEQRRLLRLAATHTTQTAAEVAEAAYKAAGGAAVYRTSPIQRCLRDAMVATQHAMVAPRTFELAGRMKLGLETDTRQL